MKENKFIKSSLKIIAIVGLVSSFPSSPALANNYEGNVRLFLGQKHLDSETWNTLDRQNEIGLFFDIKNSAWPVSIAFDIIGSGEDKNEAGAERGYTIEQHLGVRKFWSIADSGINPYLGGGLALIKAEYEVIGETKDDDRAVGVWVGAGADWHLSQKLSLGIDVRYSQADVTIFDEEIDAGGFHTGVTLGYRW